MKIPKKVQIGGVWYKVVRKSKPVVNNDICYGVQDEQGCKIEVTNASGVNKQIIENKFIHEVLHGIDMDRTLGLSEEQINSLAGGIQQSFKSAKLNFGKK